MSGQRFRLEIQATIRPCQEYPPGSGNWQPSSSEGLTISESATLAPMSFGDMAEVLSKFHHLTEAQAELTRAQLAAQRDTRPC